MSDPIATPDDLTLFLGQTVDGDRATQLLAIAQAYCEDIVSPLPASAFGIVLAAAARAYANPTQNVSEATGPYSVSLSRSVYLTRTERVTLRRAAGRSGGGSISTLNPGANAVQTVTVAATAGTFTLSLGDAVTSPLAFNASAADVQAALAALTVVGAGNVTVAGNGVFTVTFVNGLGTQPVSTLIADGSALTGTVTTAVVTLGAAAAGANLPPWEYDYSSRSQLSW